MSEDDKKKVLPDSQPKSPIDHHAPKVFPGPEADKSQELRGSASAPGDFCRALVSADDFDDALVEPTHAGNEMEAKALAQLVTSEAAVVNCVHLQDVLARHLISLTFSASGPIPRGGPERETAESNMGSLLKGLEMEEFAAEIDAAKSHGLWTITYPQFALTIVPWDSAESMKLEIAKSKEFAESVAQVERDAASIASQRYDLLTEHAQPLLNRIEETLQSESMPAAFRQEFTNLRNRIGYQIRSLADIHGIRPSSIFASGKELFEELNEIDLSTDTFAELMMPVIQAYLDAFVNSINKNRDLLPTVEEKRAFAKAVRQTLDRTNLTLASSKGEPARFDGSRAGGTKGGGFRLRTSRTADETLTWPYQNLTVIPNRNPS